MEKLLKFIAAVVIVIVLAVVVYYVMPDAGREYVNAQYQILTDKNAKSMIHKVQNSIPADYPDYTYKDILEGGTSYKMWKYEESVDEDGALVQVVTYKGNKADFSFTGSDLETNVYTDCKVKFEFTIKGNSYTIKAYIDDKPMDDEYKTQMIQQLLSNQ